MSAPVRLAVLGDPLTYTLSPRLHRAGCAALGLACESVALRTPAAELESRLLELAEQGFLGCNLTHPLKEAALERVTTASEAAQRSRSVNTIAFHADGRRGETTDGAGFVELLHAWGVDPARQRVLLLGAGGSARSLAVALYGAGCREVAVSVRRPAAAVPRWPVGIDGRFVGWRTDEEAAALAASTLVVNCTPLAGDEAPAPLERIAHGARLVDLTYGEELTSWVKAARARGLDAIDGLGLLVHQARRSLGLWLERDVPVEPLAAAVGWPR